MHSRRIACFLLGGWLVGSLFLLFITGANSDAADEVLRVPPAAATKMIGRLGPDDARMLLFYMADEATRSYTTIWGGLQLILALPTAAILFVDKRTRFYSIGVGLMVLLVLFEWLVISPQLDWLGRTANFVSWKATSTARDQYWNLRGVYLGIEVLKIFVGAGVTTLLIASRAVRTRLETGEEDLEGASPRRRKRSRISGENASGS